MFLYKYLNAINYEEILDSYDEHFLKNLEEKKFIIIYKIFIKYNFYFIEDIIIKYLELFTMDPVILEEKILDLIDELGKNYQYKIGNDLRYLEKLVN